MRVRLVVMDRYLVEVSNDDWTGVKPTPGNAMEEAASKAPAYVVRALRSMFPTDEFPPNRPLRVAEEVAKNPVFRGKVTETIEEPLELPEGAIA